MVVFEGKRTNLKVFRRFFYPVQIKDDEVDVIVYSDTGNEREVTYRRLEDYGLDNPFNVISMIRLARAMKVLQIDGSEGGVQLLRVTICRNTELLGSDAEKESWVPFDPSRIRPLDERIRDAKRKAKWQIRLKKR